MNSSKSFKVYVIIVTYNGERWVRRCLDSLGDSAFPVKVIVVDNCSTDQSVRIIRENYPDVNLIENTSNSGFGDGNNIGIRVALQEGADFVFLLNQDAWIQLNTIHDLVDAAVNSPGYDIISPLHFNGAGDKLDQAFANYLRLAGFSHEAITIAKSLEIQSIDFVNAAAWLVSKRCLETVGGFSPMFNHYGEDRDYIQRLQFHGLKIGFISSTWIFHDREGRTFDFSVNAKLIWYYYTGCVVRLSDVNHVRGLLDLKIALWCMKDCLLFFVKGRWYAPVAFVKVFFLVLKKMPEISNHRSVIKRKEKFLFLAKG